MASPIDIDAYTKKFDAYPPDLVAFAAEHKFTLPGIQSMKGQALALMAQPEIRGQKYVDGRPQATKFFQKIGLLDEKTDPIQCFNKALNLKKMSIKRGVYCLQYPFEADTTDTDKRKGAVISGDRDSQINAIKEFHRKKIIDVPNAEWQIGHLDPTIDDASEQNLAYQPPIQGKYRDRFKWDSTFFKMWPTAKTELIPNFDKYYTEAEQRLIYEALKKKFEKQQLL